MTFYLSLSTQASFRQKWLSSDWASNEVDIERQVALWKIGNQQREPPENVCLQSFQSKLKKLLCDKNLFVEKKWV